EHRLLGAVLLGALGDGLDVRLVVLAEIGGERVRDRAALAHPRERAARVETAGEGDADALADGQRAEDEPLVNRRAHAAARWARISSASSAPVVGSREIRSTVFSPAIVPTMCGWWATSIACASACA